ALAGRFEYYNRRWFLAPTSIIYSIDKNTAHFVGINLNDEMRNKFNLHQSPIVKWSGAKSDIQLIDKKILVKSTQVVSILKKIPKIDLSKFTVSSRQDRKEMYRKGILFAGRPGLYEEDNKKYKRYIYDGNKWFCVEKPETNIDGQFWARQFDSIANRKPIATYKDSKLIFRPHLLPIMLGRLLFISGNMSLNDVLKDEYAFNVGHNVINEVLRITGGEVEYI
ncbi:MAG TPA: hypothetical protein DCX03_02515, partial [Bacteroidales bacterium]|nr:hypothetical protein [Bacteroidales bacterium]